VKRPGVKFEFPTRVQRLWEKYVGEHEATIKRLPYLPDILNRQVIAFDEVSEDYLDVRVHLTTFMRRLEQHDDKSVQFMFDALVDKWSESKLSSLSYEKAVGILYELFVYLRIKPMMPNLTLLKERKTGVPDMHFLCGDGKIAIECKNITNFKPKLKDAAQSVLLSLSNAQSQFSTRQSQGYSDYIVFIDLPFSLVLRYLRKPDGIATILAHVRETLATSEHYDDFRIILTSCMERGMRRHLLNRVNLDFYLLPPMQEEENYVNACRIAFFACLFRKSGENPNVLGFTKYILYPPPTGWERLVGDEAEDDESGGEAPSPEE
jgi:hypothetical protein